MTNEQLHLLLRNIIVRVQFAMAEVESELTIAGLERPKVLQLRATANPLENMARSITLTPATHPDAFYEVDGDYEQLRPLRDLLEELQEEAALLKR